MGYVKASIELNEQFAEMQIEPKWIVVNSTGATQAGLLLGSTLLERSYSVAGMAYLPTGGEGGRWVAELCNGAASLLDLGVRVQANEVINDDREAGEGYGLLTENAVAAFKLLLSTEGIFLDPVYGAKGLAGLIRWIRDGRLRKHDTVVFVHTGGLPALFAYASELLALNVAPADAKFPGG
jgi:1-aminocyclopropane-1-carboxylate deaminase/D-cysteine desulfhydrase-like pyridoxal-dependent ACC family enzyme